MKTRIATGMMAGALAGIAGALAMNQFQRVTARIRGGREADDATVGIPRTGRGPQPARALGNASNDATARVANAATTAVGMPIENPRAKQVAGELVHLCFGAANGAIYGAAVAAKPRLRVAAGVPFGIAVWALADERIVPALGLSRPTAETSAALRAYSFTSHVIYGATTEIVRSVLTERMQTASSRRKPNAMPRRRRR